MINELASMTSVDSGITIKWSFEKVLGTLIHIAKDNEDMTSTLIDALKQLNKCNLSKLINLLYVGQDKILASELIDYSKKDFSDFIPVISISAKEISSTFGDKAPLAVIKWHNDHKNIREITGPEKWCHYTQKVQGILAKNFTNMSGVEIGSYHFNDGLKMIVIPKLLEAIGFESKDSSAPGLQAWQKLMRNGSGELAAEYFQKIVDGVVKVEDIENAVYGYDLSFSELYCMQVGIVKHYHNGIAQKYGPEQGKSFLEMLEDNCTLNQEVQDFCHAVVLGDMQDLEN